MKRWLTMFGCMVVATSLAACGGQNTSTTNSSFDSTPSSIDGPDTASVAHALEEDRRAWMVAGKGGATALIDEKGQPDALAGRYVNLGEGIADGSLGAKGWLVGSRSGHITVVDKRAVPVRNTSETKLKGDLEFVRRGQNGWLIGGAKGWVQRVSGFGNPRNATQFFTKNKGSGSVGVPAVDAAHLKGEWMVGAADGQLARTTGKQGDAPQRLFIGNGEGVAGIAAIPSKDKWYIFTPSGYTSVQSGGNLDKVTSIGDDVHITEVTAEAGTIALGTRDGRVALAKPKDLPNVSWSDALDGSAVERLVSSQAPEVDASYNEWLAVGDAGKVRRIDDQGQPLGSTATVGRGKQLRAARPLDGGWVVGIGPYSAVQFLERDTTPIGGSQNVFGGESIHAVEAGGGKVLAVGDGGRYRLFEPDGSPATDAKTLQTDAALTSVGWNGEAFLVGSEDGTIALIDVKGEVGGSRKPLGEAAISAVSWSGQFWLIVADNGSFHRLRAGGDPFGKKETHDLSTVHDVHFVGSDRAQAASNNKWLVVGAKDGKGAMTTVLEESPQNQSSTEMKVLSDFDGAFHAVGSNGREWLVGGTGGRVVRISQQLEVIELTFKDPSENRRWNNVLYGLTIEAIEHNGEHYLVAGERGAVRRIRFDSSPTGVAAAVNGFETLHAMTWTIPRGFPAGPCLEGFCYSGTCLDSKDICCESACESPCKSCLEVDTNQPSGLCEPLPEGAEPLSRKDTTCNETDKSSCGQTGKCDGDGSCAYWWKNDQGEPIQCEPPSCSDGTFTPASTCASADNASCQQTGDSSSCEPYKACKSNGRACRESCDEAQDCTTGYVCRDGSCQRADDTEDDEDSNGETSNESDSDEGGTDGSGGNGSGGGGGGCSTATPGDSGPPALWLACFGAVLLYRRRRDQR